MYYSTIKWTDVANGTGIRLSLFVSGCTHHCKGCFNPTTWDFQNGSPYTPEIQQQILSKLEAPYLKGLSLLGGEPLDPQNQEAILLLLRETKHKFPEKDIWCYTGYEYETLETQTIGNHWADISQYLDILVDGKFEESKKNLKIFFRGSENQRLIHLPTSKQQKTIFTIPDENIQNYKEYVQIHQF